MKNPLGLLCAVVLVSAPAVAFGDATITGSDLGVISRMPGSTTDVDFNGANKAGTGTGDSNFGGTPETHVADFVDTFFDGYSDSSQSTILAPNGDSVKTTMDYAFIDAGTSQNLATFTLGNSTTFNYADFNVYVLYSNSPGFGSLRDASIKIAPGVTNSTVSVGTTVTVTDTNTSKSLGRVAEFNIQGATANEEFSVSALESSVAGASGIEIGALSFQAAPEASTWAMLLGGIGCLAFVVRFRAAARV